jgi:DNA-binding LytR/AlgR family response regulator
MGGGTDFGLYCKNTELELICKTTSAVQALAVAQSGSVDLIFVDIQMPELTGIQLMKAIRNNCKIIITTAYTAYAIDGFEFDVVDYLLKPVTYERFAIAIRKLLRITSSHREKCTTSRLHPNKNRAPDSESGISSIHYIEGLRDYIAFHTDAGKILTLENLKSMEAVLPPDKFIRIHKSYIVSTDKINAISKGKVVINNVYLPIGETYKQAFKDGFGGK